MSRAMLQKAGPGGEGLQEAADVAEVRRIGGKRSDVGSSRNKAGENRRYQEKRTGETPALLL